MKGVFVDTGVWYAQVDRADPDHERVSQTLRHWSGKLITSNYVLDETITLLRYRLGWKAAHQFGDALRRGIIAKIVRVNAADENTAWAIFSRHADHSFSFTDCISFAVMERLTLDTALAIDSDFRSYGGLRCLPN
jgi:predicted nucleic acid-binding protein